MQTNVRRKKCSAKSFADIAGALSLAEWRALARELMVSTRKSYTTVYRWRTAGCAPDYSCAQRVAEVVNGSFGTQTTPESLFPDKIW